MLKDATRNLSKELLDETQTMWWSLLMSKYKMNENTWHHCPLWATSRTGHQFYGYTYRFIFLCTFALSIHSIPFNFEIPLRLTIRLSFPVEARVDFEVIWVINHGMGSGNTFWLLYEYGVPTVSGQNSRASHRHQRWTSNPAQILWNLLPVLGVRNTNKLTQDSLFFWRLTLSLLAAGFCHSPVLYILEVQGVV